MNRPALVFLAGVFLPSLGLGWLALRTIGEQQIILERRTAELFQSETDSLAENARALMAARQFAFETQVRELLANKTPAALAAGFSDETGGLLKNGVAFSISPEGGIVAPAADSAEANQPQREFLSGNRMFLTNQASAPVYQTQNAAALAKDSATRPRPASKPEAKKERRQDAVSSSLDYARKQITAVTRNVMPSKAPEKATTRDAETLPASVAPAISNFRTATAAGTSGILARFVNNELQWFFWTRPTEGRDYIFGCMISGKALQAWFAEDLRGRDATTGDLCLAILDERAKPVFLSETGFRANWKRPFVATEIGDVLPFWEAAAYLAHPAKLDSAARAARFILLLLIALALAAIAAAGYFVVRDARRQTALAAKKTDFVSNVSHELKTPLTSIRMFAELLAGASGDDPSKRGRYLRIITLESERLTRLINNVLDFARLEKQRKTYEKHAVDLFPIIERAWDGARLHLEESGWTCAWNAEDPPYLVFAEPDALSQVLVNLFSNAEKYGADAKALDLHTWKEAGTLRVAVLDRGAGIAAGEERKIFEAFYRAHDSLSSGIPGSGLGLTLAARIAQDHDGSVVYSARRDGGSCFLLTLPLHEEGGRA